MCWLRKKERGRRDAEDPKKIKGGKLGFKKKKMAPGELSNNKSTIKNTNRVIISCTSITNN